MVENELNRLESEGIIEPVQFSDWAAPFIPVLKPDGSVRICGDYKLTVNKAAKLDPYPLPRIEDLFARLAGGKKFTKLDIAHAYQQIPLDKESKESVTINTHKGLFRYNRLPFGVHSAPAIFQSVMEGLLRDIPPTVVYIDDILITGTTEEEHLQNIHKVLTRLGEEGVTLKKGKCQFLLDKVDYLGHSISEDGLQPTENKVRAIREAPAPQNVSQLHSFLGMVNYYGKFLKDRSSNLTPLYHLLQNKTQWTNEREAFERVSHVQDDGTEKPIAFASRTLNVVEKRYSQLDKEALAIVIGVKRFHQYIFGRKFSIVYDHKPLQYLLNENKAVLICKIAKMGTNRQCYIGKTDLTLSAISAKQVRKWTDRDPLLSRV